MFDISDTHIFVYFTITNIAAVGLSSLIIVQVLLRLQYARKIKSAGGVHAPILANDPFRGICP